MANCLIRIDYAHCYRSETLNQNVVLKLPLRRKPVQDFQSILSVNVIRRQSQRRL